MGFTPSTVELASAKSGLLSSVSRIAKRALWRRSVLLGALLIFGLPQAAWAQTALTWARVELLRNRVQLIPSGRNARSAQVSDILGLGDALRTARSSRAELRFNDGSLARIGERATFRFTPNTRNFQLSNGTVLLLIPPGRGRTTIQTPNAVTGIQGSALFVRYIPDTDITIIGALTNNREGPMRAYNASGSQEQPLYAGQMVVIEGDTITHLYDFDILEFYNTSGLVEGLDAESVEGVYEEMMEALEDHDPALEYPEENPDFITPPVVASSGLSSDQSDAFAAVPQFADSVADRFHQVFAAQQRSTSRYSQVVAESTTPTSSVNSTGQAHQITAIRQQRNDDEPVAVTAIPTGPVVGDRGDIPLSNTDGPSTPAVPDSGSPSTPVVPDTNGPLTPDAGGPSTPAVPDSGSPSTPVVPDTNGPSTPTVPDTTIPDAGNPADGNPTQTPARPDEGSLDWVVPDGTPSTSDTIPTNDTFSDDVTDPSLGLVEGPAPETNDPGQPEVLINLDPADGSGLAESPTP